MLNRTRGALGAVIACTAAAFVAAVPFTAQITVARSTGFVPGSWRCQSAKPGAAVGPAVRQGADR
jgi:hypothetical protein